MTITQKISAVILTYKRPENCQKIVSTYESYDFFSEIIIVSNDGFIPHHNPLKTRVLVANNTRGMYERYYGGLKAKSDYLFVSDDDFILPEQSIKKMAAFLENDQDKIHGFFGRNSNCAGLYANYIDNKESEVEMALVGLSFVHKKFFELYVNNLNSFIFKLASAINMLFGINRFNGEDILFAYNTSAHTGKRHSVHEIEVVFLPEIMAISKKNKIRFQICRTIIMWIGKFNLLCSR